MDSSQDDKKLKPTTVPVTLEVFQENNTCLSYTTTTTRERGEVRWMGIHIMGKNKKKQERKQEREQEYEMFTLAGFHKETRNKGRATAETKRSISDVK